MNLAKVLPLVKDEYVKLHMEGSFSKKGSTDEILEFLSTNDYDLEDLDVITLGVRGYDCAILIEVVEIK